MRRWRNGLRGVLKRRCPKGHVGSNPTRRTPARLRSEDEIAEVQALDRDGLNHCEIARRTGIPRSTVRDWLTGKLPRRPAWSTPEGAFDYSLLPRLEYAYLLGLYLGDGCISTHPRGVHRLRITLDARYPGIIRECAQAMRSVMPTNVVSILKLTDENAMEVGCCSKAWPSVIPQHGRGRKHLRTIELAEWQREIVDEHPKPFLRGLIHSDGCRVINKSMGHEYVRYFFTQVSADIQEIFGRTCDLLNIGWRQPYWKTISIARRKDVEFLDEFIGPKY
jgi:hypothetical protein